MFSMKFQTAYLTIHNLTFALLFKFQIFKFI